MTGTSSGDCGSQLLEFAVAAEASKASEASSGTRALTRGNAGHYLLPRRDLAQPMARDTPYCKAPCRASTLVPTHAWLLSVTTRHQHLGSPSKGRHRTGITFWCWTTASTIFCVASALHCEWLSWMTSGLRPAVPHLSVLASRFTLHQFAVQHLLCPLFVFRLSSPVTDSDKLIKAHETMPQESHASTGTRPRRPQAKASTSSLIRSGTQEDSGKRCMRASIH